MNQIIDGRLTFTNCQPSAYCGLGEIAWEITEEKTICPNCGKIKLEEVKLKSQYYDGCNWQNPSCPNCGCIFLGLPVENSEREIVLEQWRKLKNILNVPAVKGEPIYCTCLDPVHPGDDKDCPVHGGG